MSDPSTHYTVGMNGIGAWVSVAGWVMDYESLPAKRACLVERAAAFQAEHGSKAYLFEHIIEEIDKQLDAGRSDVVCFVPESNPLRVWFKDPKWVTTDRSRAERLARIKQRRYMRMVADLRSALVDDPLVIREVRGTAVGNPNAITKVRIKD